MGKIFKDFQNWSIDIKNKIVKIRKAIEEWTTHSNLLFNGRLSTLSLIRLR